MYVNKLITLLLPQITIYSTIYPRLSVCMAVMQYSRRQFHIPKQGTTFCFHFPPLSIAMHYNNSDPQGIIHIPTMTFKFPKSWLPLSLSELCLWDINQYPIIVLSFISHCQSFVYPSEKYFLLAHTFIIFSVILCITSSHCKDLL